MENESSSGEKVLKKRVGMQKPVRKSIHAPPFKYQKVGTGSYSYQSIDQSARIFIAPLPLRLVMPTKK